MVRLVLILSIIQNFLDRRDKRCFICYPISIKDLFKRQYIKCLRERPSENHAEWSTDHLSDSLHIWHTYAP